MVCDKYSISADTYARVILHKQNIDGGSVDISVQMSETDKKQKNREVRQ